MVGLNAVMVTQAAYGMGAEGLIGACFSMLICVCTGLILSKLNKKPDRQDGGETPRVPEAEEQDTKTDALDDTDHSPG